MKHQIKKWNSFRAGCDRPGCGSSLEGGLVDDMTQKELDDFFDVENSDCPYAYDIKGLGQVSGTKAVKVILRTAKKEIKDWQNLINYWEDLTNE